MIEFTIPIQPIPKARARKGKNGLWYTPERTADYEADVGIIAKQAIVDYYNKGGRNYRPSGAKALSAEFFVPLPKGHAQPPDLSNLVKALEDAGNGILWDDDSQIYEYRKPFRRTFVTENFRAVVRVWTDGA